MANRWAAELGKILIEFVIEQQKADEGRSPNFPSSATNEASEPARPDDTPATGAKQTEA